MKPEFKGASVSAPHQKTIQVGKDQWLPMGNLEKAKEKAMDIDPLLKDLEEFWNELETECDAACCGIDAFSFWPDTIRAAVQKCDRSPIIEKLGRLQKRASKLDSKVLVSSRFNSFFYKTVFIELLDHLILNSQKVG